MRNPNEALETEKGSNPLVIRVACCVLGTQLLRKCLAYVGHMVHLEAVKRAGKRCFVHRRKGLDSHRRSLRAAWQQVEKANLTDLAAGAFEQRGSRRGSDGKSLEEGSEH